MSKDGKQPAELQLVPHLLRSCYSFSGQHSFPLPDMCELELISRGPHEERWFGWRGGRELLRRPAMVDLSPEALTEGPLHQERGGNGTAGIKATPGARDPEAVGESEGKVGTGLDPARS
jgi:hypothetical protein